MASLKIKWYSLDRIKQYKAVYNLIFGMRGNGKTFAVLEEGIRRFCAGEGQLAIVRRWLADIQTNDNKLATFDGVVSAGIVKKYTGGTYDRVVVKGRACYLARYNEDTDELVKMEDPFAYFFSLNQAEHYKSTNYEHITTILFDEFIASGGAGYLLNEFDLFQNIISTIVRKRDNVTIYMCANTVSKFCPYFTEMGLKHINQMKQGQIDLYSFGNNKNVNTIAVEYCSPDAFRELPNKYFVFDNPASKMINEGEWQISSYPHCPVKYKPKDVQFSYFILFYDLTFQADVIYMPDGYFTFIHRKTTPIKDEDHDLIYTLDYSHKYNYRRNILRPQSEMENKLYQMFIQDKVFYQDNETGDIIFNYLDICRKM